MVDKVVAFVLNEGRVEFALLILLVIYVLKVNNDRETKYLSTIDVLSKSVTKVDKIEGEVVELGKKVDKLNENLVDRFRR